MYLCDGETINEDNDDNPLKIHSTHVNITFYLTCTYAHMHV